MNALTTDERAAWLRMKELCDAVLSGQGIEIYEKGIHMLTRPGQLSADCFAFGGWNFRILAPPKMRPYRDEELPELLGVKVRHRFGEVFLYHSTKWDGVTMINEYTYYDGPNAGLPVGKVGA